jgi:hypothetical protein
MDYICLYERDADKKKPTWWAAKFSADSPEAAGEKFPRVKHELRRVMTYEDAKEAGLSCAYSDRGTYLNVYDTNVAKELLAHQPVKEDPSAIRDAQALARVGEAPTVPSLQDRYWKDFTVEGTTDTDVPEQGALQKATDFPSPFGQPSVLWGAKG